ncbi:MAG: HPF/RaiA family ribosome-associated protein [Flavobacteriales bacterium]|nr:HPF/RaiA family ribosome-associated protein [Flavobacteriales bacterium]
MTIQFNTDKNIGGNERLEAYVKTSITDELARFKSNITRIEVHLSDENGGKTGPKDKRCMLEARLENRQPIAVTSHADTIEKAVNEALAKLKASLDTTFGKLKQH